MVKFNSVKSRSDVYCKTEEVLFSLFTFCLLINCPFVFLSGFGTMRNQPFWIVLTIMNILIKEFLSSAFWMNLMIACFLLLLVKLPHLVFLFLSTLWNAYTLINRLTPQLLEPRLNLTHFILMKVMEMYGYGKTTCKKGNRSLWLPSPLCLFMDLLLEMWMLL